MEDFFIKVEAHKEGELKKRWKNYPKKKLANLVLGSIEEAGAAPSKEQAIASSLRRTKE